MREIQPTQSIVPATDPLLAEWHKYLDDKVDAGDLTDATRTTYKRGMTVFLRWLNQQAYLSPTPEVITKWRGDMRKRGRKPASINVWLSGVRAFFKWAKQKSYIDTNPVADIEGVRRKSSKKHRRDALTDDEVKTLLQLPDVSTAAGRRDLAMLTLMLYTGARSIEVHRANVEDLVLKSGRLVLRIQGKGHSEADEVLVLSHPAVRQALETWRRDRKTIQGALFVSMSNRSEGERLSLRSIRGIIRGYLSQVVTGYKTTHSLRHTAITKAIKNGAPIEKVRSMARHASIETTMIYFHEAERVEDPAEDFIDY